LIKWHKGGLQLPSLVVLYKYRRGYLRNSTQTKQTMFIATVNRTKYRPNGKVDYKLVKGQEVKASVMRKLSEANRIAWTCKVDKNASVNRRIIGRQAALENLGIYSDVNLEVLKYLSNTYTNRELLDKKMGQNGLIKGLETKVIEHFGFQDRRIELEHTDDFKDGIEATVWVAWFLNQQEAEQVAAYLETL
jgi:hypothetical protein